MMKFVAVLALIAVAVSAKEHFKQPQLPCAWTQDITMYEGEKKVGSYHIEMNGRYMKLEGKDGDEEKYMLLVRADIGNDDNVTIFEMDEEDDECYVEQIDLKELAYYENIYSNLLTLYVYDKDWDHKETKTYRKKKCDYYYDDDDEEGSIYVYDGRIFAVLAHEMESVIEYEDKAPMEDFVISKKNYPKCVEKDKKVAEVPSDDFVFCAASSVKVAIVAVVAAVFSALF